MNVEGVYKRKKEKKNVRKETVKKINEKQKKERKNKL